MFQVNCPYRQKVLWPGGNIFLLRQISRYGCSRITRYGFIFWSGFSLKYLSIWPILYAAGDTADVSILVIGIYNFDIVCNLSIVIWDFSFKEVIMNRRKRSLVISIAILAAILCLCAGTERDLYALCCGSNLEDTTYTAGDMLERNLLYVLDRTLPILSTSFVNLDNLKETSAFGRLIGVQIASR